MQSLLLKSPDQIEQARQSVAAYAQVQQVLDQISQINHELLRRGEPLVARRHERTGAISGLRHQGFRAGPPGALGALPAALSEDSHPLPVLELLLGVILRAGSYLDISQQTKRRRWQHLIHWGQRISDDAFHYVSERLYLEDLRQSLAEVNQRLKANKALESCKINGLLFLSLDANEHFQSRSRCCPCCCQREVEETDAHGQKQKVIEYYHRYVFAQINGPKFNALLDLEPIRPGEGEAEAALRLLGPIRRVYGVRFFDAVTIDSWYVQGPFLKGGGEAGLAMVGGAQTGADGSFARGARFKCRPKARWRGLRTQPGAAGQALGGQRLGLQPKLRWQGAGGPFAGELGGEEGGGRQKDQPTPDQPLVVDGFTKGSTAIRARSSMRAGTGAGESKTRRSMN